MDRVCPHVKDTGEHCRQAPLQDEEYCFWHSPEHQQEAAEARRLGGLRRRREKTVATAYDVEGLASVDNIRRLLEIAVVDTLGLENSVARSRTLAYLSGVAAKLLELEDLEGRLQALEETVEPRLKLLGPRR